MPFGLKGAAQTFQHLMDSVLRDMLYLFVYLDDILVTSASMEDHMAHLWLLFEQLSEHGLIVNPAKCQFGQLPITFLGYHVTPLGAVPLPTRVNAVTSFPRPCTVQSLNMVNFYNCFLPHTALLMCPLYEALWSMKPKDDLDWSPESTWDQIMVVWGFRRS